MTPQITGTIFYIIYFFNIDALTEMVNYAVKHECFGPKTYSQFKDDGSLADDIWGKYWVGLFANFSMIFFQMVAPLTQAVVIIVANIFGVELEIAWAKDNNFQWSDLLEGGMNQTDGLG